MSQLQLYWISGSPFSWRVQLALALHNIDYVSHCLSLTKMEQKQPEYLALNPRGKVPLLQDGDFSIRESMAILAYLNTKFSWNLFGTTAAETGIIWQHIFETEHYISVRLRRIAVPIFFNQVEARRDSILEATEGLKEELERLNAALEGKEWLAGDRLTAADVATYPAIQLAQRAASREQAQSLALDLLPLAEKYPQLVAWMQRLENLPGAKETYPPHWQ